MNIASNNILRGRQLAELFFTRNAPGSTDWTCRCGARRSQKGSWYTNLVSHITADHPGYVAFDATNPPNASALFEIMVPRHVPTAFGWLYWITLCLLPFSFVSNPTVRRFANLDSISRTSFMKYMHGLSAHVEKKVALLLPEKFALVFDGRSCGSTHYLALFASYPSSDVIGYSRVLLSFAPINEEESLSAAAHVEFTEFVLDLHGKSWSNVIALIGDNCSTNVAFARLAGVPFIGCASHRFNLFVSDMLTNHATVIDKVNALMTKLRFTLPAARLRRVTPLRAIILSATRWSSTFNMLKRYIELKPFLLAIADDSIDVLRLNVVEDREVTALLVTLEDLNSITLALQGDECSLLEVRQIFDTVIEDYPDAVGRLGPSARVVKNPSFESAIVKILRGTETTMTAEERESVIKLRNEETIESSAAAVALPVMSLAERALKKKKVTRVTSGFMDFRFLCPTSNMCERFFSSTKVAIGDRRCSMTPKNFKKQMFLHANINLWTIEDVQEMMRSFE